MPFVLGGEIYEMCVDLTDGNWCLVPDEDGYSGLKWSKEACEACTFNYLISMFSSEKLVKKK